MSLEPVPLNDYYCLTEVTDVAVSPDGERVAYVADEFDPVTEERLQTLFVTPADGSDRPHRLTTLPSATAPTWSPDGSKLAFLANRPRDVFHRVKPNAAPPENGEDERPEVGTQVWFFDFDRGGDANQATAFSEGAEEFDWGPNGERLVVAVRDPTAEQREYLSQREEGGPVETRQVPAKFDDHDWLDDVTKYLFVVDLNTDEVTRLDDAFGVGAYEPATGLAPAWSPDGEHIAFLSNRTDRSDAVDVYFIRPDGTGLEQITETDVQTYGGRWSPDGSTFAFVAGDPNNWYVPPELYVATSDGKHRSISGDLDRPIGRQLPFGWVDNETLIGAIGDEGLTRLARFHVDETDPERLFDEQGSYRTMTQLDTVGGTIGFTLSSPSAGLSINSLDVADVDSADAVTELAMLTDDLVERYSMPECRRLQFKSLGCDIEAIAYLPPDFDHGADTAPVIASIHGGPYVAYDEPEFSFDYLYWTSRGYVVLCVNYRGSATYGREFGETIRSDWGKREADDVINGLEHLIDKGWANPDRLFVTGFSYGGAQTAYILTRTDIIAAGAAEHGVYDRYSYFGTSDSQNRMERQFGLPWENPETYANISSITDVDQIETPLIVTAGGRDWRCPPTQAEQLYTSVNVRGVPAKLVIYPNEHHNIGDPDRAIHRLKQLTAWFEEHDPTLK